MQRPVNINNVLDSGIGVDGTKRNDHRKKLLISVKPGMKKIFGD